MNDNLFPTVDRPKPNRPSTLYVWDNKCSALDAEWECLPYALDKCEYLRREDGWAEDYIQCLDDRFTACRSGAGCDYRYNTGPETCSPTEQQSLAEVIQDVCNAPDKEYPSRKSYQACVDRVTEWSLDGCGNVKPGEMAGPVMGFGPMPPRRTSRIEGQ
jgi:hypothetical protein